MADIKKVNTWFHSSRVKFPLVKMSASWFLVSMYLIWILGSRLIRSNNQSRTTLWVLETCLIVGLLPFIIILIAASLSSNTYTEASWRADWTFEGTESMSFIASILLWDLWCLCSPFTSFPVRSEIREIFPRTETIRSHNSRASKPSNLNLFLTDPTYWNKCMTSKNAKCSPWSGFWIFNISREIRVLKQSQSALFSSISHITILFVFTRKMNLWNQSIQAFVTSFGPFCYGSCELITDHRISGRPIFAKYKHFRTIWEHVFDNSPTDFVSSSMKWWSSMHGVDTL